MKFKQPSGAVCLALCASLWSIGGILIKLINWNPMAIAGIRSLIGASTIIILTRRLPRFIARNKDGSFDKKGTIDRFIGAFAYCATMILFVVSTKMTTAANAVLLQYTEPIWIILMGRFFLDEKISLFDYIAIAGVFLGMILFFSEDLSGGNMVGNILAILSGVTFAATAIFLRRQKDGTPSDSFIIADILTFVISIPFWFKGSEFPDSKGIIALLLLGVLQMGIPSVLYSRGITRVTAVSASLITMLEPLLNPVWVLFFYNEKPSWQALAGGVVILFFVSLRVVLTNRDRQITRKS